LLTTLGVYIYPHPTLSVTPLLTCGLLQFPGAKKNKNVVSIAQNNVFVFLYVHRSVPKGWQLRHVHGRTTDFVSRSTRPAEDPPLSASKMNKFKLFVPEGTMPLGMFLVAFPPPPVTFPATRLKFPKDFKRRSSHWLIISSGCYPFLSG